MAMRPCLTPGCPVLTRGTRCEVHEREFMRPRNRRRDAQRGTSSQRSYGKAHREIRAALLPLAYGSPCPRCGEPMVHGQALDLGHSDARAKRLGLPGDRIEHALCNRRAGGKSAHGDGAR